MLSRLSRTALVLAFLCAAVCGAASAASDAAYGANLLQDGDAEASFGATDAAHTVKPAAWETTGGFTVVQYGASGDFPGNGTPGTARGELNFFAGGDAPVSTAKQTVSLAPFASAIDAGTVRYTLSASLGGYGKLEDDASVTVEFLDASGASLGKTTAGPVSVEQRLFNTAMVPVETSSTVPKGARSAVVTIVLRRAGSDGYNHGYADSIALVLQKP